MCSVYVSAHAAAYAPLAVRLALLLALLLACASWGVAPRIADSTLKFAFSNSRTGSLLLPLPLLRYLGLFDS